MKVLESEQTKRCSRRLKNRPKRADKMPGLGRPAFRLLARDDEGDGARDEGSEGARAEPGRGAARGIAAVSPKGLDLRHRDGHFSLAHRLAKACRLASRNILHVFAHCSLVGRVGRGFLSNACVHFGRVVHSARGAQLARLGAGFPNGSQCCLLFVLRVFFACILAAVIPDPVLALEIMYIAKL